MAAEWYSAPAGSLWVVVLLGVVLYRLERLISDVFRSPLAAVPGPKARAASRLPLAWSIVRGTLVGDAYDLHQKYGPVVRIAPNEVSLAAEESWQQVLQGHDQRFLKDPVWWGDQIDLPTSIVTAIDPQRHKPLRRAIAPGFAPEAIKAQEAAINGYVDLLIDRLRGVVRESGKGKSNDGKDKSNDGKDEDGKDKSNDSKDEDGKSDGTGSPTAVVDLVPWLNFAAFDIFGALFFSHSFDCLQRSEYHEWIAMLFKSVKLAAYVAAARLFPVGQFLLLRCIPPALRRSHAEHYGFIVDRLNSRYAMKEGEVADLMSQILRRGDRTDVPVESFNASMMIMTIAGSETIATTLSGTLHYLVNSPGKFEALAREVRARFDSVEDVTLDAVEGLPYLEAVVKEGLRLCPSIPFILPRRVPKGGEVVCGTWLPGGSYTIHRRPDYYHEAASFMPERWLCERPSSGQGSPEAEKSQSQSQSQSPFAADRLGAVQTFGLGPRHCPGKELAWAEMRLTVAKLVMAFDLLPLEDGTPMARWEDQRVFVLVEKTPLEIRLRERTDIGASE